MDEKDKKTQHRHLNINVDPMRTPVLYADSIRLTSNENGMVLDIAQSVAGTNQAVVVSRIGMSREHAKKLAELIGKQLMKQGVITTGKSTIIN